MTALKYSISSSGHNTAAIQTNQVRQMKSFQSFRLDTTNQCLWRGQERVPISPKAYDVLRYFVENPGRLVTPDELLEKLWPETYVNPEVFRKYILDIRKILGDRPDKPEFIETVTKRGYRFIAPVMEESPADPRDLNTPRAIGEDATEKKVGDERTRSEQENSFGKRRLWKVAILPVLTVVAAFGRGEYFRIPRNTKARRSNNPSIAVLPFAERSLANDQEYFTDGLAEQLIHELAKVSGLRVVGRSSAFQFRGKNEDLRDVGRKLGVANILEGSVRREGNHIRITAELTKANDGFQLWSQTYDRQIKDIFAVQDEIARATTEALQLKLLGSSGQQVASNLFSANPEAYQAYLQAKYFSVRGQNKEDLGKALPYADQAIKLDEKYAPAWALRASVQNLMAEVGVTDAMEGFRKGRHDAEQAIALDPTSAAGYLAVSTVRIDCDWDWNAANTSVTKAAGLEPGTAEAFRIVSYLSTQSSKLTHPTNLNDHPVHLDPH